MALPVNATTFRRQAQWGAPLPTPEARFGLSVAASGDTAIVGMPNQGAGAAYVFVRSGTTWTEQQALHPADGEGWDHFGAAVAISGDSAVVGAYLDDVIAVGASAATTASGPYAGAAYLYSPSGTTWTQTEELLGPAGGVSFGRFAWSIATSGDVVLVGTPMGNGPAGAGTASVYSRFAKGDLDRNGQADLFLRHEASGHTEAWLMNGLVRSGPPAAIAPEPDSPDWTVAGTDDFDGDGRNDLLYWNAATGATEFWLLDGAVRRGDPVPLASALLPPWEPSATADFDQNGSPDVLYRNSLTLELQIWLMNGLTRAGIVTPTPSRAADANRHSAGAQDWNGDGNIDLLWYNVASGKLVLWFLDERWSRLTGQFTNPDSAGGAGWELLATGDYGTGAVGLPATVDLVWRNATSGRFVVWHMDRAGNRTYGTFTSPDAPDPDPTAWTIVGPR